MPDATFQQVVGRVKLYCPMAGQFLAEDFVRNAFYRISRERKWSWLIKQGQFLFPLLYNTGTVAVTRGSTIVTGTSTTFTQALVGLQFRTAINNPIYTVQSVQSTTQLTLDTFWGGTTTSGIVPNIYRAYVTVPDDFHSFISVYDPNFNWQLNLNYSQNDLNAVDAQRANVGQAYLLAWLDFTRDYVGQVAQPVQTIGTGSDPATTGTYTGPNNAIFTVQITTAGASGTAVFKWKKDDGTFTTGVTTSTSALTLQDGVQVYFPTATYTLNDVWAIQCIAGSNAGLQRYEVWPHIQNEYVLPYIYEREVFSISDPLATIPRSITTDVLLEGALAEAARWPGPSPDKPNSYYRLELADRHEEKFTRLMYQLEVRDEDLAMQDVMYQSLTGLPFAVFPNIGDTNWLQDHAI